MDKNNLEKTLTKPAAAVVGALALGQVYALPAQGATIFPEIAISNPTQNSVRIQNRIEVPGLEGYIVRFDGLRGPYSSFTPGLSDDVNSSIAFEGGVNVTTPEGYTVSVPPGPNLKGDLFIPIGPSEEFSIFTNVSNGSVDSFIGTLESNLTGKPLDSIFASDYNSILTQQTPFGLVQTGDGPSFTLNFAGYSGFGEGGTPLPQQYRISGNDETSPAVVPLPAAGLLLLGALGGLGALRYTASRRKKE